MKRLYNIDSLKFLCAVLVIFLHVRTPYQEYILPLTRCAVPCFFMISGYLIFTNDKLKLEGHLRRGIKKMVQILIWSTLLFAAVKFLFAFKNNDFSFLNLESLGKFILLNENPFGFHLWYIGAYLYVLIIILFLERRNKLGYIYWAIPVLLLLDLCFGKYSLVLWHKEFPLIWVRNFACVGLPYFTIGMLLKQQKERILNFSHLQLLALGGGILSSLTSLLENRLLTELNMNSTRDHYISSTFLAVSLFTLFLSLKQSKANAFSSLGEKDSLYIYIFHPLFITFFSVVNKFLSNIWQDIYLYYSPFIILMVTILFNRTLKTLHIIK